ncbi:MmgE/PrpD family protein [Paenibacillus sp. OK060]|uniref:MmgE/PrpD family protein n=1 Tax=Paenibacillus sp. OK060 TaxID=1881034 RepID=UPI000B866922
MPRWQPKVATGVCGTIAAAALVCKLTDADADAAITKDAMGIASLFTGGLIEYHNDGTFGKILCSGWAALTGLKAVRLASCGFTGPDAALEG